MEHLTKQQIVLVTILTSFVTSIATGIVVVSLIDTPTQERNVVQTINRVVERTIEKVVTPEIPQQQASVIETVKTITVPAEDLIASATEKSISSIGILRLVQKNSEPSFVSLGAIVSRDGVFMTDASSVNEISKYTVTLYGQKEAIPVQRVYIPKNSSVAFLKLDIKPEQKITPLEFADPNTFKPGQTLLVYNGRDIVKVNSALVDAIQKNDTTTTHISTTQSSQLSSGAVSVNLQGLLSGIHISEDVIKGTEFPFMTSSGLKEVLGAIVW